MNTDLKGKRLLVLGGSIWRQAIKDFADQNCIVLVSAGLYPAGTDEIADEVYRIDTTDGELMKPFIKEHQIDGVYMGGSEMIISAACQYINELGLPCYCTKEQWDIVQDKRRFKDLCVQFGLPVVPKYDVEEDNLTASIPSDAYPVVLKPADGCGSKGFSVCHSVDGLKECYENAAKNSPTHSVICEKYVNNDGVGVFYSIAGDRITFCGSEDKTPVRYEKQGSYVGGLYLFPSSSEQQFRALYEEKIIRMFNSIGLYEGSIWIEVFKDADKYFFNEVGFRYGGTVSVYPVDYLSGVNQVYRDIYFSLTGESLSAGVKPLVNENVPRKLHYCVYPVHILPGKLIRYIGVEQLRSMPSFVTFVATKSSGTVVEDTGSFSQIAALVHFVYSDLRECVQTIETIHSILKIEDERGRNMINRVIDDEVLIEKVVDNQQIAPIGFGISHKMKF